MFVCPSMRLKLSIGIPLLMARTAKVCRPISKRLDIARWGEIIKDKILVNALVDRLTHKAYLVNMNGQSYRLKETRDFNQKLQKQYGEKK